MSSLRRLLPLGTLAAAIAALYLYNLDALGVVGPDEPRYAAIGRAMAYSGDFVTPRLWGSPWFEKPPLLYWLTALGTAAGLNPELSGRLPIVVLSLSFLCASFVLLQREFGSLAAVASTALLATSAGWITYSQLCLTDLPLAVFFTLGVYLVLPLLRPGLARVPLSSVRLILRLAAIGASLGFAALAKGLVPVALALPFFWFLRRHWRTWWAAFLAFSLVALPWYMAVYLHNGYPFIQDFFLKHHFERLYSASLQHVQPWYYYPPVLLAGIFPWTPLLAVFALRRTEWDQRRLFLAVICAFGLLFFSLSRNKLPGYLLPLLPSLFVLIATQFNAVCRADALDPHSPMCFSRGWLAPCSLLIALIPLLTHVLPQALSLGRFSLSVSGTVGRTECFYIALPVIVVCLARRSWAGLLLVLCVVSGAIYLKARLYPVLDQEVSARGMWKQLQPLSDQICEDWANRDLVFGLSFYHGNLIPACESKRLPYRLLSHGHGPPTLEPRR